MIKRVKVTNKLSAEKAEQLLLTLIDESERGEEMRLLYNYLKGCDKEMKLLLKEAAKHF